MTYQSPRRTRRHISTRRWQPRYDYLLKDRQLHPVKKWLRDHSMVGFVGLSLVISLVSVFVGLWLYQVDGTAKLDLSRPGYEFERAEVETNTNQTPFPSSGRLDENAVKDFDARFSTLRDKMTTTNGYGGPVLTDENLGLN